MRWNRVIPTAFQVTSNEYLYVDAISIDLRGMSLSVLFCLRFGAIALIELLFFRSGRAVNRFIRNCVRPYLCNMNSNFIRLYSVSTVRVDVSKVCIRLRAFIAYHLNECVRGTWRGRRTWGRVLFRLMFVLGWAGFVLRSY